MEYFYIKCCDNIRFYYKKPLTIPEYDKYIDFTMNFFSGKSMPCCTCFVNENIKNINIDEFNYNLIRNIDVKEHNNLCKTFNFRKIF